LNRKLKEIVAIRTGIFLKPSENGDTAYIQPKYFDQSGELNTGLERDVNSYKISQKHFLEQGDILFAAKGTKNFAATVELQNDKAVASTSFFVLSPSQEIVTAEYICWFLNQEQTKRLLKREARGSAIVSIPKSTLSNIEVPVPSLEQQAVIVKLAELRKSEKQLQSELNIKMDKLIRTKILKSLKSN